MTVEQPSPPQPRPRARWWTILFGLSLALNLAIGGILVGHRMFGGPPGRGQFMQLLPREFFSDLSPPRRRELLGFIRDETMGARDQRSQMRDIAFKLADALEKQPYDHVAVEQIVAEFATGRGSIAARSPVVFAAVVNKLTDDERLLLAKAIRERESRPKFRD